MKLKLLLTVLCTALFMLSACTKTETNSDTTAGTNTTEKAVTDTTEKAIN
jgi:outer membrane biogenesis lipoprotein LolB